MFLKIRGVNINQLRKSDLAKAAFALAPRKSNINNLMYSHTISLLVFVGLVVLVYVCSSHADTPASQFATIMVAFVGVLAAMEYFGGTAVEWVKKINQLDKILRTVMGSTRDWFFEAISTEFSVNEFLKNIVFDLTVDLHELQFLIKNTDRVKQRTIHSAFTFEEARVSKLRKELRGILEELDVSFMPEAEMFNKAETVFQKRLEQEAALKSAVAQQVAQAPLPQVPDPIATAVV